MRIKINNLGQIPLFIGHLKCAYVFHFKKSFQNTEIREEVISKNGSFHFFGNNLFGNIKYKI